MQGGERFSRHNSYNFATKKFGFIANETLQMLYLNPLVFLVVSLDRACAYTNIHVRFVQHSPFDISKSASYLNKLYFMVTENNFVDFSMFSP